MIVILHHTELWRDVTNTENSQQIHTPLNNFDKPIEPVKYRGPKTI